MSQISGDYNSKNPDEWSNYDVSNKGEPSSDASSINSSFFQNSDGIQQSPTAQSFEKIAHTEESILRSAILSDHLTDVEFKKSKWKEAVDTTGKLGRLRYKWNKVKSSIRAFVSGFERRRPVGNLKSRSRNQLNSIGMFVKNKETSFLPSSCCFVNKKDSNVSEEMLSLYMDGIELGNLSINKEDENKGNSTFFYGNSFLVKNDYFNPNLLDYNSSIANSSLNYSFLNKIVNYGQLARSEPIQFEPEILLRRVSVLQNSLGSSFFKRTSSSSFDEEILSNKILEENSDLGTDPEKSVEFENSKKIINNSSTTKKTNLNKSSKDKKEELKRFEFFHAIPPKGLPVLVGNISGTWISSSYSSFRIPQSKSEVIPIVNFSVWGRKDKKFLDSSLIDGAELPQENSNGALASRFQKEISTGISDVYDDLQDDSNITIDASELRKGNVNFVPQSSKDVLNGNQDSFYVVSSAYSFFSFSGFAAENIQKKEEERLLSEQKRAAELANVLVYQYRTIGLNPPLVLRKPASYVSDERPYIVGKPSAEEAYNEQNPEDNLSNNNGNKSLNNKRKRKN